MPQAFDADAEDAIRYSPLIPLLMLRRWRLRVMPPLPPDARHRRRAAICFHFDFSPV